MAKITLTIDAGAKSYSKSRTVSEDDLQRIIDALRKEYVWMNTRVNASDLETDESVVDAWAKDVFDTVKNRVKAQEADAAIKSIASIDM